jgi:cell division protein ZipA
MLNKIIELIGLNMENNLRVTLIIISAVVICGLFLHGLWKIRKHKNPYALKTDKTELPNQPRSFDGSGFEQDGVSQVKVKPSSKNPMNDAEVGFESSNLNPASSAPDKNIMAGMPEEPDFLNDMPTFDMNDINDGLEAKNNLNNIDNLYKAASENGSVNDDTRDLSTVNNDFMAERMLSDNKNINELNSDINDVIVNTSVDNSHSSKPLYQEPVIRPKPSSNAPAPLNNNVESINKAKHNKAQTDRASDDSAVVNKRSATDEKSASGALNTQVTPEVLSISVVMPTHQMMSGASLLPNLLTLGLKHGEMNIFHRHQDNAGNGAVTFSLANMMNPGTFDLDTIETFATQGITLFMMLPNAGHSFTVYEQMLSAAKQLGKEFDAQLLDEKRNVITKQTEQHYMSRIRDFEIKYRVASA